MHQGSKASKKIASETTFFDQAHQILETAISFMRRKFRAADSYHGKDARAFWNDSRVLAEESIAFLEQNISCLQVHNRDQLESLEDAVERIEMGYAEYKDQLSLAYWSLSAAIDLRERLEGRGLIKARACEDAIHDVASTASTVASDISWIYSEREIPTDVPPSSWQQQSHRAQTPANAGVFHAR